MQHQKTALISVYNKNGLEDFAKALVSMGWKIISSGGTAKYLSENGIAVTDVEEITGMPAILGHRVATLHPKIHGGLLALDTPEHIADLEKYGISRIDMVCVDFYPLEDEVANPDATRESVIEKTDIGGPTMIRASAKGGRITICDPIDRPRVIEWLQAGEPEKENFLNALSAKAEAVVGRYCSISGEYHSGGEYKAIFGKRNYECAYGENAYQKPAALFENLGSKDALAVHNWKQVGGSAMSYNNICDLDRMIQTVTHIGAGFEKNFSQVPFVAIGVKHGNPCGAGVSDADGGVAVEKMLTGDLRAIFGGMVMVNFPVDEKIAEDLIHKYVAEGRRLLDMVAAPSFSEEAIEILSRKKGKCRLVVNPKIEKAGQDSLDIAKRFRYVRGGFLEQPNYTFVPVDNMQGDPLHANMQGDPLPLNALPQDAVLAWAVGSTSNSNTITLVKDGQLLGNGVGQQDRVGAAKLAISRADESAGFRASMGEAQSAESAQSAQSAQEGTQTADLTGATAYSDSFFPFPDAPEVLIDRGIKTIFSTSGSVNDEKIIELCKNREVKLILIPDSEARGFYQH
ncbi:MAG TPA: hypothetical protein VFQ59_01275 [Candidatus Paceibacterota bacterium]|nr:hypothetical protein [Candidatus Paceibacterota bacterium]